MFMPQVRNIINEKGNVCINYIGKFETLEQDFQKILGEIGVKQIIHDTEKKSMNKREHAPYYEYYDQMILNRVNSLLKEDFEKLDYKMCERVDELKLTHTDHL